MKRLIAVILSLLAAGVLVLYGVVILYSAARNDREWEPIFATDLLFFVGSALLVLAGVILLGGYLLWRRRA